MSSSTAAAAAIGAAGCCVCSAAAASAAWSRQLPQSTALGADSSSADGSAAADSSSAAAAGVDSDSELSFIDYQPERYAELLQQRSSHVTARFRELGLLGDDVHCEIHPSAPSHYRLRVGFGVYDPQRPQEWRLACASTSDRLRYVYWDAGALVAVAGDTFPIASTTICEAMPTVLDWLSRDGVLRAGIRATKFLSTLDGKLLVTLIYKGRGLGTVGWHPAAEQRREEGEAEGEWSKHAAALQAALSARSDTTCVGVIGRSKNVRVVVGESHVIETGIVLQDGRKLVYKQPEQAFSNPNGGMAIHTLNWLSSCADTIRSQSAATERDSLSEQSLAAAAAARRKQSTATHQRTIRTVLVLLLDATGEQLLCVSTERQDIAHWDTFGAPVLKGEAPAETAWRELQGAISVPGHASLQPQDDAEATAVACAGNFGVPACKAEAFVFQLQQAAGPAEAVLKDDGTAPAGLGWVSLAAIDVVNKDAGLAVTWRLNEALSRAPDELVAVGTTSTATSSSSSSSSTGGQSCLGNDAAALKPVGLQLLELYCGNGNHTVAMAGVFDR